MNADFRVSTACMGHPKIVKLRRRLGADAVLSLFALWAWTAQERPSGCLHGMDAEDIAIAADWSGDEQAFTSTLIALRLLDADEGGTMSVHDWAEHNPWAAGAEERQERAKQAASSKWKNEDQPAKATRSQRMAEAKKKGNHSEAEWKEMREFFGTCVKCEGESGLTNVDRDHITPIYQGGSHGIDNIQPLCAKCNSQKGPDATDWRPTFCEKHGIEMPAKWVRTPANACDDHCPSPHHSVVCGVTTTPNPSSKPSPAGTHGDAVVCGGDGETEIRDVVVLEYPPTLTPYERQQAETLVQAVPEHAQELLDELAAAIQAKKVKTSPVAYLRGLAKRAAAGTFAAEAGQRIAQERERRRRAMAAVAAAATRPPDAQERRARRAPIDVGARIAELRAAMAGERKDLAA